MRLYDLSMMGDGPWHRALAQGFDLLSWPDREAASATYVLAGRLADITAHGHKLGGLDAALLGSDLGISEAVATAALTLNGWWVSGIGELRLRPEVIADLKHPRNTS